MKRCRNKFSVDQFSIRKITINIIVNNFTDFFIHTPIRVFLIKKEKVKLQAPLGKVYAITSGNLIISCRNGLYHYFRKQKKLSKICDVRNKYEKKYISYNDGTISNNKLWICLIHIKETKNLGYFGYIYNNKFNIIDSNFKVGNGPVIDKKNPFD